jgi:group II intron reverse transcriptase/maturase
MRIAEIVLEIIEDRGKKGQLLEDVYRQLYNPQLYLEAYTRIYKNDGAMTKGTTEETVDGMSLRKINRIIEELRYERYQWTPVRRVHIPKKDGKTRPLGIPSWSDKLLQAVMQSILEAYYEPQFSPLSYGFRPGLGCHTALRQIQLTWKGTKWFIEGDIRGCFDNIKHDVLLNILREKIQDNRFLLLIDKLLKAGYMENWKYNATYSGTPQGGIVSPILSNIYLDKLDKYVEETLIPEYNKGETRKVNPVYERIHRRIQRGRKAGNFDRVKEQSKLLRTIPYGVENDPGYRRLRYIRYADDFILGFVGPKKEAEEIKEKLRTFLAETLRLEMSESKTLITHAQTERARFLGYELVSQHNDSRITNNRRTVNGAIGLRVPTAVIESKCAKYMKNGKPIHRPEMLRDSDFTIVSNYQSEFRGIVQYYQLALNVSWFNKLRWVMESSLLRTLANRHKTTTTVIAAKYKTSTQSENGPRKCVEVRIDRENKKPLIARFGGISLVRKSHAVLNDILPPNQKVGRNELLTRLLADECEICKADGETVNIEVHHIRKLADLNVKGRKEKPLWVQVMAARRRKTLVLCTQCHYDLHAGRPLKMSRHKLPESRMQ